MPLEFSDDLKALIATGWCGLVQFIEITLGDATQLFYATRDFTADDDHIYIEMIKSVEGGKLSLGKSVDRVQLTLYNADAEAGRAIVAPANQLHNTRAIIGTIYVNLDDPSEFYRVEEDTGIVTAGAATDDEVAIVFISDTYAEDSIAGDLPVLSSCGWQYRKFGCGYAGGIPTCDQTFDGKNGCIVHFDYTTAQARYGGVALFLDDATVNQLGGSGSASGDGGNVSGELPYKNEPYTDYNNY
jgi:hypothetical protein